jgi:hypothetical protein
MKNLFFVALSILLFTACNQEKRYTQQSTEIESYKKVIENYVAQDWKSFATHYADTTLIFNNATKDKGQTLSEAIASNKAGADLFNSWNFIEDESNYEMVITDDDEIWVNFWGLWKGNLKANNKAYEIPCHMTAQFVDGKIVRENGYWNTSELLLDMQEMERIATIKIDSLTSE